MDILTVYAWASSFICVWFLALAHGHRGEPTTTLAVSGLLVTGSNVLAWLAQWLGLSVFLIHRRFWGWLLICFVLNVVGSTIAYLFLRPRWDSLRPRPPADGLTADAPNGIGRCWEG